MSVPSILRPSKIYLLGEAPGRQEALLQRPFVGESGKLLRRLLADGGIDMETCSYGNVFTEHPTDNKLQVWAVEKSEYFRKLHEAKEFYPPPQMGLYIDPDRFLPEIARVAREISEIKPNIIIALGGTALWALTKHTGIKKLRGAITNASTLPLKLEDQFNPRQVKVLPTYHPAAVLRDYSLAVISMADFAKAKHEAEFPEIRVTRRAIYVSESYGDFTSIVNQLSPYLNSAQPAGVDVETFRGQIDTIGIALSPKIAMVTYFFDRFSGKETFSPEEEKLVWRWHRQFLAGPKEKIFQNGNFDVSMFLRYGARVRNWRHDTMLQHHALYSELPKGLDFLGSIYANEPAWKTLRPRGAGEELKRNQ